MSKCLILRNKMPKWNVSQEKCWHEYIKKSTDENTNIKFWEDVANYVFKNQCKA